MTESQKTEGEAADAAMRPDVHVEQAEPTLEERAKTLVADFEHAHKHNSPIAPSMIKELKALLPHGEPNEDSHPG